MAAILLSELVAAYDAGEIPVPKDVNAVFMVYWTKEHKEKNMPSWMPYSELVSYCILNKEYQKKVDQAIWGFIPKVPVKAEGNVKIIPRSIWDKDDGTIDIEIKTGV